MDLIFQKSIQIIKEKEYALLGFHCNDDRDLFLEVVKIIKYNGAFYLPEVKSWFINKKYFQKLKNSLGELENSIKETDDIRKELAEKVYQEKSQKLSNKEIQENYDGFSQIRGNIFLRDKNKCQICGSFSSVCHHIIPTSYNGKTNVKNLTSLCSNCHGKVHGYYRSKSQRICYKNNKNFFSECINELKKSFIKKVVKE